MPKQTRGTIAACPCPWCGTPNDFRDAGEELIEPRGEGEKGAIFYCDNPKCRRRMEVVRFMNVPMIWLAPA